MPRRTHPRRSRTWRPLPVDTEPDESRPPNSIDWEAYVFQKVREGVFPQHFLTHGLRDTP